MTTKNFIGLSMFTALLILFFGFIIHEIGLRQSLILFGATVLIAGFIILAAHLITSKN